MRNFFLVKALPGLLIGCIFSLPVFSQSEDSLRKQGLFDLLAKEEVAEITLVLDIDTLMAKVRTNDYIKGEFRIDKKKKEPSLSLPVRIRPRGKFRRITCDFPPIKLKFKKDDLETNGLGKYNEFKLVTHCMEDEEISKEMIMREYLVYKLYNELTPYSFRVQLVKVTYQHERRKSVKIKRWGILIEDLDDLAHRNNSKIVSRMGIPLDSLHDNQEKIASTFQFMIGNCDWSYLMARNTEFIQLADGKIVPVPYDFDYAGIVNAPYARFDPSMGQTSIRDRVYLGYVTSADDLHSIFSYFKTKKEALYQIINNCTLISKPAKKDMREYLDSFYTLIEDKVQFEATIAERKRRK